MKLVYRIKIDVENPQHELKSNMPADAEILPEQRWNQSSRLRDLTRRFGDADRGRPSDLEVARGEIFGLVGPDGAGKTTTLRLLCGLLDPSEGSAGWPATTWRASRRRSKTSIGYMAQRFGLYADLTVEENMDFYADLFGIAARQARAETARCCA